MVMLGIVLCTTGAPRTSFCTIDAAARTAGQMKKREKWAGEATVGTKIYFAPLVQAAVGVLDTETATFSTIGPHDVSRRRA